VTPDERNLLQAFLSDLTHTQNVAKDAEADAMIQDAIRANPDAAYLLVQHAILADQALHAAQAQIEAQRPSQPAPSFLPQASAPWAGQGGAPVQSSPFAPTSGLGGFLKNAGQMAAGVAVGDFLFQGIENIFSPRW
jgi:hypothetical protein